jgi:broad specificity phosphatase PhoE
VRPAGALAGAGGGARRSVGPGSDPRDRVVRGGTPLGSASSRRCAPTLAAAPSGRRGGASYGDRVSPTEIVLIRHAESVWNAERRWQGQADPPLSARGRAQAAALACTLEHLAFDRLYASDLVRALETARIIGAAHGLAPQPDARLRELDVGRWEGRRRDEIEAFDGAALLRFDSGDLDAPAGGGESRRAAARRVRAAAAALAVENAGCRIALVTHLGVIRALAPGTELDNAGWHRLDAAALPAPDAEEAG